MNTKKRKRETFVGFIGGLLFAIGDILFYLLPNVHNDVLIMDDWIKMSAWRPAVAVYLGCIGAGLLLVGFYSWYCAIKEEISTGLKRWMLVLVFGILLTPIGHFVIAGISPMAYKGAVLAGASSEMALEIIAYWAYYMKPIKVAVTLIVILFQSVTMIVMIIKRKIKCPLWMVILNPLGLTILSIPASILLNGTGLEGIAESFESLGEGLMYIPVYYHWKNFVDSCDSVALFC